MCVIVICNEVKPKRDILEDCGYCNPDGAGIAWIVGKKVHYLKGLDTNELISYTKHLDLPYVVHFRIATAGGVTKNLCHPFPIRKKQDTKLFGKAKEVLFHNGHVHLPTRNSWSDSKELALKVAQDGKEILKEFFGQRFVLMNHKRFLKYGNFTKRYGLEFSNMRWDYSYKASNWSKFLPKKKAKIIL